MARIAHLTSVHSPNDTRIFHKECRTLQEAGHEVVLIAPNDRDQTMDGVRIRAVRQPRNRLERMVRTVWQVYQAGLKEDADIYHFHDPELIPIGLLLRRKGKPVVYDIHEDYTTSIRVKAYLPRFVRAPLASLFDRLERAATKQFDPVLAERYYTRRFPQGLTVLNYPVKEHFESCPEQGTSLDLLYAGVVNPLRGSFHHARIVALLKDVQVYIVGRCSHKMASDMYRVAGDGRERLHLVGAGFHVPYQRILDHYARGQWLGGLAVFPPSVHYVEKEPTKLFEYMGAGIPIICSDFPVWRSLIEETGAGLCIDPLDSTALTDAIRFLSSHPDEAQAMGQNGRRAFLDKYNWDTESKKLLALYDNLVSVERNG